MYTWQRYRTLHNIKSRQNEGLRSHERPAGWCLFSKQKRSWKHSPLHNCQKRSRECNITEEEWHESDNGVKALKEVQELDEMETLVERMEQISAKLDILDEIERKMNKLDSIEEKIEKFLLRLDDIEKSVSSLRCEVNSSKEKQAELQRLADEVKDSVDCAHARTDVLELKSYKLDADFKEAKEDLRKKNLYLEAYSRREKI